MRDPTGGHVRIQGDRVLRHPLPNVMRRRVMLGRQRAHDVPFGEDADQVLSVDHQGRPDVLEAHDLGGLRDGCRRWDRDEIDAHELAKGRHDRC